MSINVQIRRDTSVNWTASVVVLLAGQPGYDTDKKILKIGDGSTLFDALPVFAAGKQTIYIPASALTPATTSGPAAAQVESTTNKLNYGVLDFDGASAEYAHFTAAMPKSWDEGTVTFKAFWETTNTGTAGVAFGVAGRALSDGDTIDSAFGTEIFVTDAGQSSAAKRYITAESAAVTIAGSPAAGDICHFRVSRDPANGSDTMTEDARLVGLQLFFTTNVLSDE